MIVQESNFHPRRFLSRLNRVIIDALTKDLKTITVEFIKTVPEVEEVESPGIEDL